MKKEIGRWRFLEHHRKWKDVFDQDLGSGWLSKHPKDDFDEEFFRVRRELKRLGLE